jgi:hypothetical protein
MDLDLDDHFTELSNNFTSWLISSKAAVINPSIALADLRSSGAGRGVGAVSPPVPLLENSIHPRLTTKI